MVLMKICCVKTVGGINNWCIVKKSVKRINKRKETALANVAIYLFKK